MQIRKLKPIRPGDKRFVNLTFKSHDPDFIYASRGGRNGSQVPVRGPLNGTKTFIFEIGQNKSNDITLENADSYLPNRGTVSDRSAKKFIKNAMRQGVKARVGERTRGIKEAKKFFRLWSDYLQKTKTDYEKAKNYFSFKKHMQAKCAWFKYRHKLIKREIMRALKEGSVESIYGTAHSTIASDLRKAGVDAIVSISPTAFRWDSIIVRKAEKRKLINEIDYKRAYAERMTIQDSKLLKPDIQRAIMQVMIGKVPESVLDEIIAANPKDATKILLEAVGVRGKNDKEIFNSMITYFDKYPYWRDFFKRNYANNTNWSRIKSRLVNYFFTS